MENELKLPIGIENFEEIRTEGFYYIDKTGLIKELLSNWGKVNLFTRPRRFGKSLNMSMLKYFFEIGCDEALFEGLEISNDMDLCDKYMGKFPVISVSLKGVKADDFEGAKDMLRLTINEEAERLWNLIGQESNEAQRAVLRRLLDRHMSDADLMNSLRMLSALLYSKCGKKVILLIDEYDVPLDKAYDAGYYQKMVAFIRNMFEQVLKTNDNLYFAVLTGCLRIAKESIFTGLNNFNVFSITDVYFDEYFGFTDKEVRQLLDYYKLSSHYEETKAWYDGYRFGQMDVYCPWDVINHCKTLRVDPDGEPQSYWINTSSNNIVKNFIDKATKQTQREIERLIAGESIEKTMKQELTYSDLDKTIDNLWSVLFTTGYLTMQGKTGGKRYSLVIPNLEIREIFVTQIQEWFAGLVFSNRPQLRAFCMAFKMGDPEGIEKQFNSYLIKMISIRDTFVGKPKKENFYHGLLLGLLGSEEEWIVTSNAESGEGYSDITIEIEEEQTGIVIEVKYSESDALDEVCQQALIQIENKQYAQKLWADGMKSVFAYGIACHKKHCRVLCKKLNG